jgi:hypothetical protein
LELASICQTPTAQFSQADADADDVMCDGAAALCSEQPGLKGSDTADAQRAREAREQKLSKKLLAKEKARAAGHGGGSVRRPAAAAASERAGGILDEWEDGTLGLD